jgi:3D (Asp-Asp-Asp) domain-containing protein
MRMTFLQNSIASRPAVTPFVGTALQRKCACGGSAGIAGECEECSGDKLLLQRSTNTWDGATCDFGFAGTKSIQQPDIAPQRNHNFSRLRVGPNEEPIQAKLEVSSPDDYLEREADGVAQTIVHGPEPKLSATLSAGSLEPLVAPISRASISRQIDDVSDEDFSDEDFSDEDIDVDDELDELEDDEIEFAQAKRSGRAAPSVPHIETGVKDLRGGGRPLSTSMRAFFEPRFGHDFGAVRVHTDACSDALAQSINARAFTSGSDIVFAAGQFSPDTTGGQELLAHELTHVLQQGAGSGQPGTKLLRAPKKEKKPKGKPNAKEAKKAPADKERTKWRLSYKTLAEVQGKFNAVKDMGLNPEAPIQEGGGWTFFYFPRTKDGAEADATAKQKQLGAKHTVRAEFSKLAESWFVKVIPKCPEGIPDKKAFRTWSKCYPTQKEAEAVVKKFKAAHIKAEVVALSEANKFGVYFQPLTEKEAEKAGIAEAEQRPGFAEKMYEIKAREVKDLESFTYDVSTVCPPDYPDKLGSDFELTAYVFALESEFPEEPKVKDPCGLKGEFNRDFLNKTEGKAPLGVKMEGSGISRSGKFIQFTKYDDKKKENCFQFADCAVTKMGPCATVGRTVAVDKSLIPLGTELLIEDIGPRVAEDTGGRIIGKHIDVYYGGIPSAEANRKSFLNKRVCKKKSKKK